MLVSGSDSLSEKSFDFIFLKYPSGDLIILLNVQDQELLSHCLHIIIERKIDFWGVKVLCIAAHGVYTASPPNGGAGRGGKFCPVNLSKVLLAMPLVGSIL